MKKGITSEYDFKDGAVVLKKRMGKFTLDEIEDTLTETCGYNELYFMAFRTGAWDDQLQDGTPSAGDCIRCYSYDEMKQKFSK